MLFRIVILASTLGVAVAASAQARSAFNPLDGFSDIFVTQGVTPEEYTLSLGAAPSIVLGGVTYHVDFVFGFWVLSYGGDLLAAGADEHGWGYHENSTDVAGWKNPSKSDKLLPSSSLTFTYDDLAADQIGSFGLHVSLAEQVPGGENTIHVELVPEPGAAAGLAIGVVGLASLLRRRR